MKKLLNMIALAGAAAALIAPTASAAEPEVPTTPAPQAPPTTTPAPKPAPQGVEEQDELVAPPAPKPKPKRPVTKPGNGGVQPKEKESGSPKRNQADTGGAALLPASPPAPLEIPLIPTSICGAGAPPALIPIYQAAAAAYALGPQGPAVLAAINEVETAFGTNTNVSSAGAVGWMQFMPATWSVYGVDANGDGDRNPYDPEDAIFSAANYLSASGMPQDTPGAVFAYNHADWYVADVLAKAGCYQGGGAAGAFALTPQLAVLTCRPADERKRRVPAAYLNAFEEAAARYGLGRRGVWALAAVARLESNFGKGMGREAMQRTGPLGIDGDEWRHYAVDGDGDGKIRHADPADSAATMARLIWAKGSLRAGVFSHNQAAWYVEAVLGEADRLRSDCEVTYVDWSISLPVALAGSINWDNLTIVNEVAERDLRQGAVDPRIVGLLGAITRRHEIVVSSLRSDHSQLTVSGGVSNHWFGRAMDISAVDGVSCTDTGPVAPCANLGRSLAFLPPTAKPTELIYCFDLDGPGAAFARADHCDHLHVGYDG